MICSTYQSQQQTDLIEIIALFEYHMVIRIINDWFVKNTLNSLRPYILKPYKWQYINLIEILEMLA